MGLRPLTNEDMYLATLTGEDVGALPEPRTNAEMYLKKMAEDGVPVDKDSATFFEHDESVNLLDLSKDIIWGKYINLNDGSLVDYTSRVVVSKYVPLQGPGTYTLQTTKKLYGSKSTKIAIYNSQKQYLETVAGTLGDDSDIYAVPLTVEITNPNAAYLGNTIEWNKRDTAMVVKAASFPGEYVPYSDAWTIPDQTVNPDQIPSYNDPLYKKVAVFDGDSICSTVGTHQKYADIISIRNSMDYKNYAVSGGTITSEMYNSGGSAKHWVSGTVDTMYAEHPDADYIIFEGGTNDADLIGSITGGTIPEQFGSYDDTDFSGSYDATTFCGAVETIIYKAMQYWPSKKIGFIIAMKMGTTSAYANRRAYFQTLMDICKKWGVPYLNLWDECSMNPKLISCYDSSMTDQENIDAGKLYLDGQHPTPLGQSVIAAKIEAWMRTL